MVAAGRTLKEEELVEYILTGLDADFNPIVSALVARKETVIVSEAYQQLLAFETHMDMLGIGHSGSSTNMAMALDVATTTVVVVVVVMATTVVAATVDMETSQTISAKATMVVVAVATPSGVQVVVMASLCVRFVSKEDIPQISVGTDLRRAMSLKKSMHRRS